MTVILFAGTSEGRNLYETLAAWPDVKAIACVATTYGEALLPEAAQVYKGRLDEAEMVALFAREKPDFVVDATHPYAIEATRTIHNACEAAGIRCVRLLREEDTVSLEGITMVDGVQEAVRLLQGTQGNILLLTGVKAVTVFAKEPDLRKRLYARVLPMVSSLEQCLSAGIPDSHIIAMQGPFSMELNAALMRQYHIQHMVTKDSGVAGGFSEKLEAARQCGVHVIVLKRPVEQGLSFGQVLAMLDKEVQACKSI